MVYLIQYYHHKKGPQAKTLIREAQQKRNFTNKNCSNSAYPKTLQDVMGC